MKFKIVGKIRQEKTFATGRGFVRLQGCGKFMVKAGGEKGRVLPRLSSWMVLSEQWSYTGTRPQGSAGRNIKSSVLWIKQ